jgi:hypothetical protein
MMFSNFHRIQKLPVTAALPTVGALVYRGSTFPHRQPAVNPLFRYERRVIILESATLSNAYEMRRFEVTNRQSGFAGSVQVSNYR